ncbi:MAG: hypothetical protein SO360_01715 [Bifidobacterium tsurumiense]|uniref:hypothetical protein n=1 Tax=Bifidobacterium tsurumiense TaxID=356829 RepID=UPI002A822068|nr:hypothetical protein [Bifidobacterium tsurumiense]MDY4677569.1 hypothetical protein [Bifidobacterium tsurumiense]
MNTNEFWTAINAHTTDWDSEDIDSETVAYLTPDETTVVVVSLEDENGNVQDGENIGVTVTAYYAAGEEDENTREMFGKDFAIDESSIDGITGNADDGWQQIADYAIAALARLSK